MTTSTSNVRPMRPRTEPAEIYAAAERIRYADCIDGADLADLLAAVAWGFERGPDEPELTETEMWRMTRALFVARRIAGKWSR